MNDYRFRILNVFAREDVFSGNPLAVFEDGSNFDETTMQSLALQFNLSETTFILPSTAATTTIAASATTATTTIVACVAATLNARPRNNAPAASA